MVYFSIKVLISAILIALISEISKQSMFSGAILASIPLISVIAIIWLYIETKNIQKIVSLSYGIFWLILPSLTLFIILFTLLKLKTSFGIALFASILIMVLFYFLMTFILKKCGIQI